MPRSGSHSRRFAHAQRLAICASCELLLPAFALAEESPQPLSIDVRQMFIDGGAIGYVIVALSLVMVARICEHFLTLRPATMIPRGLADDVHRLLSLGQLDKANEACRERPSLLGHLLSAGLSEISVGYTAAEKAMEDVAAQQSARIERKLEVLSLIGALAPMLGLMGTVWGMILAFMEFERKTNPPISALAPGIYKALVTTLFGLIVAVPAIAAYAFFRSRSDEMTAQAAQIAEHVFHDVRRRQARANRRRTPHRRVGQAPAAPAASAQPKAPPA